MKADLFLLHAPSVYDFRERDDVLFAYLSDSDSVNVTPVYEMFPLGFLSIKQRLAETGLKAEIVNIASLMLMHPGLNVEQLLSRLDAPVFGFDLHWMAQCHGALELAARLKAIHPEALIIFGGMSATYYANELIRYPSVDIVVRGFDTLDLVTQIVQIAKRGERNFSHIPNLVYRGNGTGPRSTPFVHKPATRYNNVSVDWSFYKRVPSSTTASKLIMTLPNSGCAMDCPWCGGSRFAYRNIMGVKKTLIQKDSQLVHDELRSLGEAAKATSIYALQCYSESTARMQQYLDGIKEMGYKSVFFEQVHLTEQPMLKRMAQATQSFIMLSPESHDRSISRLAGRGQYSMEEMEAWIPRALDTGVAGIMVWFFIGLPQQTRQSVMDTVAYAESLMKRFRGHNVVPLICPMVPFLDPGSRFFEHPEEHGYRIFHRTLDEHRNAMVEPLWHRRLNYETRWLSRRELQDVCYEAIARLVTVKGELDMLPSVACEFALNAIEETTAMLAEMDRALAADGTLSSDLRLAIREYNARYLSYSSDQIVPARRPFGGRWFDDFTVPKTMIEECSVAA